MNYDSTSLPIMEAPVGYPEMDISLSQPLSADQNNLPFMADDETFWNSVDRSHSTNYQSDFMEDEAISTGFSSGPSFSLSNVPSASTSQSNFNAAVDVQEPYLPSVNILEDLSQNFYGQPSAQDYLPNENFGSTNMMGAPNAWGSQTSSTATINDPITSTPLLHPIYGMQRSVSALKRPMPDSSVELPSPKRKMISSTQEFDSYVSPQSVPETPNTGRTGNAILSPCHGGSLVDEIGLNEDAADICVTWFSKRYSVLPSDQDIEALSHLTRASTTAIRHWFGQMLKQGMMTGHDSAYKSQSTLAGSPQSSVRQQEISSEPLRGLQEQSRQQSEHTTETSLNSQHNPTVEVTSGDHGIDRCSASHNGRRSGKKNCTPTSNPEMLKRDESKIYQCTRKCGKRYGRKCDWKRNEEEGYPSKHWLCSLCKKVGLDRAKPCYRRYHFTQHFNNIHPNLDASDYEAESLVETEPAFPRRCGFCSTKRFASRQERIDHVADHFKKGKCMLDWNDSDDSDGFDDDKSPGDGGPGDDAPDKGDTDKDPRDGYGSEYDGDGNDQDDNNSPTTGSSKDQRKQKTEGHNLSRCDAQPEADEGTAFSQGNLETDHLLKHSPISPYSDGTLLKSNGIPDVANIVESSDNAHSSSPPSLVGLDILKIPDILPTTSFVLSETPMDAALGDRQSSSNSNHQLSKYGLGSAASSIGSATFHDQSSFWNQLTEAGAGDQEPSDEEVPSQEHHHSGYLTSVMRHLVSSILHHQNELDKAGTQNPRQQLRTCSWSSMIRKASSNEEQSFIPKETVPQFFATATKDLLQRSLHIQTSRAALLRKGKEKHTVFLKNSSTAGGNKGIIYEPKPSDLHSLRTNAWLPSIKPNWSHAQEKPQRCYNPPSVGASLNNDSTSDAQMGGISDQNVDSDKIWEFRVEKSFSYRSDLKHPVKFTEALRPVPNLDFPFNLQFSSFGSSPNSTILNYLHEGFGEISGLEQVSKSFLSVKLLGTGGFSLVDEVIHRETKLTVCRKTLKNHDKLALDDLNQEVKVLQQLRHPHIIRFLAAYSRGDKFSILLSPVAETTLSVWLDNYVANPPPGGPEQIVQMFGCLASSIRYLHQQRPIIKHMDIKPQNILVMEGKHRFPHVVLSDFGISRMSEESSSNTQPGPMTRRYCAPEVANSTSRGSKADIWSLGCVFLEMALVVHENEDPLYHEFRKEFRGSKCYYRELSRLHWWLDCLQKHTPDQKEGVILQTVKAMLSEKPAERPDAAILTIIFSPAPCCLEWPNDTTNPFPGPLEEMNYLADVLLDVEDAKLGTDHLHGISLHQEHDCFQHATEWLHECSNSHTACRSDGGHSAVVPTRLIDLRFFELDSESLGRLVSTNEIELSSKVDYITLSYVWGNADQLMLTSSNLQRLLSSIPKKGLPKPVADAMSITKRLGYRYLWVDSLCIIQDSQEDRNKECNAMAEVYRNAVLTIASDNDSSSSHPCPTSMIDWLSPAFGWNTRAWALQERLLSKRVLHLADKQMYWECNELKASETFPHGLPPLLWESVHTRTKNDSSHSRVRAPV